MESQERFKSMYIATLCYMEEGGGREREREGGKESSEDPTISGDVDGLHESISTDSRATPFLPSSRQTGTLSS